MSLKICHIADVHIRGLTRHAEMRTVFEAFVRDAKEQKVDAIFIAGDVYHTKTMGISPEYLDFMRWWLTELAGVAPVHIILGNHDMNCVNLQRQDAISPIVNLLNNPNVFLYKNSGVYQVVSGVNLCVFSLFDEERWNVVLPVEDEYNVAAFHGSVRGAKTEGDWELTDGLNVDFFKDFDLALLGDIHRQQFLGYRNYDGTQKPWIGYPGSIAQQNFSESLEHGYLLWDIDVANKTHDVSFRKLPNPHPFVTVEWQGNVSKTLLEAKGNPPGTRFRIRSSLSLVQKDVNLLVSELKNRLGALEVVFKIDDSFDSDVISTGTMSITRNDLRNTEVLIEMMKEYYETEDISDDQWNEISDLVRGYMKSVSVLDDCTRNTKWSIKKLEFENLYAYGEGNVINFEKFSGITGIFGPNRTGKSSIIGALLYNLFNASDRGSLKNLYLINNRKDYCLSRVTVCIGGIDYIFERQTVKHENKKGPFGVTSLNAFKVNTDGTRQELNGDQRFDTDKIIRNLIGTSEDFLITSVSTQDYLKRFIQEGPTVRKQIISRFLDLDVFEKIHDIVAKDVNVTKAALKNLVVQDWSQVILGKKTEAEKLDKKIQDADQKLVDFRKSEITLKNRVLELQKLKPITAEDVQSKKREWKSLEAEYHRNSERVSSLRLELETLQGKLEKLLAAKELVDLDSLRARYDQQRALETSFVRVKHLYEKENAMLAAQEKSVLKLLEVPCGDQFLDCKFIRDSHHDKLTISEKRQHVSDLLSQVNVALELFEEMKGENLEEKIKKCELLYKTVSSVQSDVSSKAVMLVNLEKKCEAQLQAVQVAVSVYQTLQNDLENSQSHVLVETISELESVLEGIRGSEREKMLAAQQKGRVESDIEKLLSEEKRYVELVERLKLYELVSNAFSKRGVPNRVIHNQLPIINHEIAKILQGITNFTVELETDSESNSLDAFINYGDSKRVVELGSGMEKVLSALAIRVALTIVSTLPKTDMLVIDEGFSDLDESSIEICNRMIRSLKKHFRNVFIITHLEGIKEVVDNMIEITKLEHDSRVFYE